MLIELFVLIVQDRPHEGIEQVTANRERLHEFQFILSDSLPDGSMETICTSGKLITEGAAAESP